jgi:hypothetical protein
MARRFITFWRFYPHPAFVSDAKVVLYACAYIPVFLFMVPGAWLAHRAQGRSRPRAYALVDAWVLYTVGIHTLILAMMRYRVPLMPLLMVFAATALWRMAVWVRSKGGAKTRGLA